jgi:polygalacturonase
MNTHRRRGFLTGLLALAAAPSLAGFAPTQIARTIAPGLYVNVRDFGAWPHPLADNTSAFQAAIAEASRTGQRVYIPSGTYRMKSIVSAGSSRMEGEKP